MNMLEKLRQQKVSRDNANEAVSVINDKSLSFSDKVKRVQALEAKSSAVEQVLFAEVYSSLHGMAITQEDINLMAGI
jgi:hypothetical protein